MFEPGQKVTIKPQMFPMQVWQGTVMFKTKNGFKVSYEAFGVKHNGVFSASELTAA